MVLVDDPVKNLGQYFTPSFLADFIVNLIDLEDPIRILEPSAGSGVFVKALEKRFSTIVAIEIDRSIPTSTKTPILYQNFFDYPVEEKFDVIIGNPPYVRWRNQPQDIRHDIIDRKFWNNRINALADLFQAFMFKSIDHLKPGGQLLFITPKFWLQTLHAANLREFIVTNGYLDFIIDLHEKKIFPAVSSNLLIVKFCKASVPDHHRIKVFTFLEKESITESELFFVTKTLAHSVNFEQVDSHPAIQFHLASHPTTNKGWSFFPEEAENFIETFETSCAINYPIEVKFTTQKSISINQVSLLECLTKEQVHFYDLDKSTLQPITMLNRKLYFVNGKQPEHQTLLISRFVTIADIFEIGNGMVSGLDKAFWIKKKDLPRFLQTFNNKEKSLLRKVVKSRYMNQYTVTEYATYIFIQEGDFSSEKEFQELCPHIYDILEPYKNNLAERWSPKPISWYVWSFPRNYRLFQTFLHKFFVPCKERFDNKGYIRCVYEKGQILGVQDITVMGLFSWVKESPEYLLAYLNSDTLFQWLKHKGLKRGGVFQFSEHPLSSIPIRLINWNDPQEVSIQATITQICEDLISSKNISGRIERKEKIESLFRKLIFKE